MIHAMHEFLSKIINYYKCEALSNFSREKERNNTSEGKKRKEKKKDRAFARPSCFPKQYLTHRLHTCLERYALLYCGARAVIKA